MSYIITIQRVSTETKETSEYQNTHRKADDGSDIWDYVKVTKPVTETIRVYEQRTEKDVDIKPLIDAFNAAIRAY